MDINDTFKKEIDNEIDKHSKAAEFKIQKFLSPDKPSDVLIIKSHLICEYYINQILIVKDLCDFKKLNNLSFYEKVSKAFNLNDPEENKIYNTVINLNKLRNKVGHELEYVLSESDVDMLGYSTGKDYLYRKYDYTDLKILLLTVLINIVIKLSMYLFKIIYLSKNKKDNK